MFNDLISKAKKAAADIQEQTGKAITTFQDNRAKAQAIELQRQQQIVSGEIEPIAVTVTLNPGEVAFLQLSVSRMAPIQHLEQHTVTTGKRKGVLGRALVGGALLGRVGALGGAITSGRTEESVTTQNVVEQMRQIDGGTLVFTDSRFIFLGRETLFINSSDVIQTQFSTGLMSKPKLVLRRAGMLPGEYFELFGPGAKDAERYIQGIAVKRQKVGRIGTPALSQLPLDPTT